MGRCLPSSRSSAGKFEFEQARALARRGHEVIYCYSDNRSIRENRFLKSFDMSIDTDGVRVLGSTIPIGGLSYKMLAPIKSAAYKRCLSYLEANQLLPDVAYIHFPALIGTDSLIDTLDSYAVPFVCMEHWTAVLAKTLSKSRRTLLRRFVEESARFCCVSEDLARSAADIAGVPCEQLAAIPNAVSSEDFYYDARESLRADKRFRFVWSGRIERVKRLDVLIEAFARLDVESELLIAGDGSAIGQVKTLCRRLGVEDRVSFLGWKTPSELGTIYRSCDCFVSASPLETFCVPFAEAWMCGLPVIGVDSNPLRGYFTEENGIMFESGNVDALTKSLVRLINGVSAYDRLGIASNALQAFSEKSVISRIETILLENSK